MPADIEIRKLTNAIGSLASAYVNNTRAIREQTAVLKANVDQQAKLIHILMDLGVISEKSGEAAEGSSEASAVPSGGATDRIGGSGEGPPAESEAANT